MIVLPNDCRRSEFHVFPGNWKTNKAKLTDTWYADCRFIDPQFMDKYPKGKNIRLKAGINLLKTVGERKYVLQKLIEELEMLFNQGYNPITRNGQQIIKAIDTNPGLTDTSTPFISALRISLDNSSLVKETKDDIKSVLKHLEKAANELGYINISIGDLQIKHIKLCLDHLHKTIPTFSEKRFNKSKAYISGLFKYLIEIGAAYGNMAKAISPMKETPSKQIMLTDDDVKRIKEHLSKNHIQFYKFMMMFYYSGGRIKELLRLQVKNIDLIQQKYSTIVKKGKKERWVDRTIRNVALPFWKEQLQDARPNDFVFSYNLLPHATQIRSTKHITKRWTRYVRVPLGIKATFYKLKHRSANETVKAASAKLAAGQMGHTTTRMAEEVYAFEQNQRIHEELKGLDIEF